MKKDFLLDFWAFLINIVQTATGKYLTWKAAKSVKGSDRIWSYSLTMKNHYSGTFDEWKGGNIQQAKESLCIHKPVCLHKDVCVYITVYINQKSTRVKYACRHSNIFISLTNLLRCVCVCVERKRKKKEK